MTLKIIQNPANAKVDIVLVHGVLRGQKPWTSENGVFWPEKFLFAKAPNARIMCFEYEPDIAAIRRNSQRLIDNLIENRSERENERRPLIFIAHCLGGIVLENALQVAADPYSNEKLIEYVHGILLLGTPHFQEESSTAATAYLEYARGNKTLTISELPAYIKQLISIPPAFIDLKQGEVKFEVESFYADADATKLVGEDLARCPKTPPSRQLDRTQLRLSQYDSVDDKDLEDVLGILAKWLVKIAPPEENEEHREPSIVSNATFTESKNSGLQLGQNSGTLSSIRFTNETK